MATAAFAQSTTGELHLTITDATGAVIAARAEIISRANHYDQTLNADTKAASPGRHSSPRSGEV